MKEIEQAIKEIENVIKLLSDNQVDGWRNTLILQLKDIKHGNTFSKKEALFNIGIYCDPKALGDVIVFGCDWQEWGKIIDSLYKTCGIAFNKLQEGMPIQSE